ncbi:hypothetical protein FD754_020369 [Muntiacus muntjak]|uniref:NADH dehydrogenase [ubiquinone] 1 alpha subcomplex assembly factor 4 n=1 Tax=Muntiacus muntjak TaxID=9888 RepID=A0A5N3V2S2_MUNMU|nr:hypothetical protein FD754_020369 [Muntiacus muntjak]
MKPSPAPRHPSTKNLLKDDKLLSLLKDVYVDSQDPVSSLQEFRLPKDHQFDMMNVKNISKGKISQNFHCSGKIAEEYHLEQQDVNSLLKYFVTFEVKIFPPETKKAIQ